MLDAKTIRKLLMTAVVVALTTTPAAAATAAECEMKERHYGLFCNDGRDIRVCGTPFGCTVDCGRGAVPADSC